MNGDKLHRAVDKAIHAAFGESVKVLEAPVKLSHLSPLLADTKLYFRSPVAAALDIMCRKEICGDLSQVCARVNIRAHVCAHACRIATCGNVLVHVVF